MTKRSLSLLSVVVAAAGIALVSSASAEELTPLGKWMKPNMGAPKAAEDYDALVRAGQTVASHVPPGSYGNWAKYANDVVAGAQAKDMKKVSAACKGCHTEYKQTYRAQHATRAYP